MITYNDNSNSENYTVLFEKASVKLGLIPIIKEVEVEVENQETHEMEIVKQFEYSRMVQEDGEWIEVPLDPADPEDKAFIDGETSHRISSLNEYFQHIEDLASLAIGNGRSGSDPYFLRLPLDEPFFEINANTRAITVPAALRQVGVVGDKYAEIVFFKIDRYYDAIDLNTRQIYIEWEAPDGEGGVRKGVSRDFLRDTQSEKDKIIFGWVIGDELTKNVGNIRFAVRFVEWNAGLAEDEDGKLIRVEDPDSAVSGTELAYSFSSLPAQITIVDSLHYDLFDDSKEASMIDTDGQAGTILFFLQNSDPDSADQTAPETASLPIFIRDLVDEHDLEDGVLRLQVEAIPEKDSGTISYMFGKKATLKGEGSGTKGIVARIDFIKIGDGVEAADGATLYIKKGNNVFEVDDGTAPASEPRYEKVAYMIAAGPGYYFANARNTVSGKKTSSATSNILYIPYAATPTIEDQMPERFVIKEVAYSTEVDTSVDQSQMPGAMYTNIKIVEGEEGPATITLGAVEHGPHFSAEKTDSLTYTWYRADNAEMTDAEVYASAESSNIELSEPGFYCVKVENAFNNDTASTEMKDAGVIRVTNMPVIPKVRFEDWGATVAAGNPNTVIEIEETEHDHITYEWHRVTGDNTDEDPIAEGFMDQATGEVTFTDGVGTIPFLPLGEGFYYFILKNELNGASILMNSGKTFGTIYVTTGTIPTPVPGEGHAISYAWAGEVPEAVAHVELPKAASNVVDGTLVRPRVIEDVEVEGGKYVLTWAPEFVIMAGEDVEFVGTWTFVADESPDEPVVEPTTHTVTYTITKAGENIPEGADAVLPTAPDAAVINDGAEIPVPETPAAEATVDYVVDETTVGTWTFGGWVANSETYEVTGTWTWAAAEVEPDPEDQPVDPGE